MTTPSQKSGSPEEETDMIDSIKMKQSGKKKGSELKNTPNQRKRHVTY